MHKALTVLAALGIVLAMSSGAYAAKGLLTGADIKNGSLTGANIANHSLGGALFTVSARESLEGNDGPRGLKGKTGTGGADGSPGLTGSKGDNGAAGPAGTAGSPGSIGTSGPAGATGATGSTGGVGTAGATGSNGAVGATGLSGSVGATGLAGATGASGSSGANGTNGTVTPLSATAGLTALPTASPPIIVVSLNVPAGSYVILAKTQLAHTGAGDSIDCSLKAGTTTIDQIAMKTLPALAAVPVSLQAVATVTSTSQLSVQCAVEVANGTASFSSLIAIPTN